MGVVIQDHLNFKVIEVGTKNAVCKMI